MKNFVKVTGIVLMVVTIAHPTYDFAKQFVNKRDLRVQNTHVNFSKYLRYGS